MTKEISEKLGDIECAARKMEAIGAFIYETCSDDFDDGGLRTEVVDQAGGTIMNESAMIRRLVKEIQNGDQAPSPA